jgi:hypothetical protein
MELLMQFSPASHHFIHLVQIFSYAPCSETTPNNLILIMEEKMYVKNRLTESAFWHPRVDIHQQLYIFRLHHK